MRKTATSHLASSETTSRGNEDRTPVEWDDQPWEVFLADEDQCDPQPEPGDFWGDPDQAA